MFPFGNRTAISAHRLDFTLQSVDVPLLCAWSCVDFAIGEKHKYLPIYIESLLLCDSPKEQEFTICVRENWFLYDKQAPSTSYWWYNKVDQVNTTLLFRKTYRIKQALHKCTFTYTIREFLARARRLRVGLPRSSSPLTWIIYDSTKRGAHATSGSTLGVINTLCASKADRKREVYTHESVQSGVTKTQRCYF